MREMTVLHPRIGAFIEQLGRFATSRDLTETGAAVIGFRIAAELCYV